MTAVPLNFVAKVVGFSLKFKPNIKGVLTLPQKPTLFSPVSDIRIKNKADINYNTRYTFNTAEDVYNEFGMCPAYLIARLLKPKSGGGINTPMDIFPIKEENATNTIIDVIINGDNTKDVAYNIIINGRRFNDGNEIKFIIPKDATLREKIDIMAQAVNRNIFSPVDAQFSIIPAKGKIIETTELSTSKILEVNDGGATFITNSGSYDIKVNTAGKAGGLITPSMTSNIPNIVNVVEGSLKIAEDNGIPKELIFKKEGMPSKIITQSMTSNFKNFSQINSNMKIKCGADEFKFTINSDATSALHSSTGITTILLNKLKTVSDGSFSIQTDEDSNTIDIVNIDLTTINNIEDVISILNNSLNSAGSPVTAIKSMNADLIFLKTNSSGVGSTIKMSKVSPATGTDLYGQLYLNFQGSTYKPGLDALNTNGYSVLNSGVADRIENALFMENNQKFVVTKTLDNSDLIFSSRDLNAKNNLELLYETGTDLTGQNYFDLPNAFEYINIGQITDSPKLMKYLETKYKELELGEISIDAGNKISFKSKTVGSNSNVVITAGATGIDLTGATYFNIANATQIVGLNKAFTLQNVVDKFNDALTTAGADVDANIVGNKIEFENNGTLGISSTLAINNLALHNGEQLVSGDYLDIANSKTIDGNDEVDTLGLTTKWSGTSSQGLNVRIVTDQEFDNQTNFVFKTTKIGNSQVELGKAFDKIGDVWTTLLINIYGKNYLDVFEQFVGNADLGNGRYDYALFKPAVVLTGSKEDKDALLNIAENRALDMANSICTAPNTEAFEFEIAGAYAEICSRIYEESPHLTTSGVVLNDIPVPIDYDIGSMNNVATRDILVKNGVSTVSLDPVIGKYQIEDHITTRHPPTQPVTSVDYRYVRDLIGIDFNIAFNVKLQEQIYILNKTIISDDVIATVDGTIKLKQMKGIFITLFLKMASDALLYSSDEAVNTLNIKLSSVNAKRVDVSFSYKRSGIAKIISTTASASFQLGG